jgi:phospholipid/cholesterol/gamma-HCH transport system permease protein
MFGRFLQEFGRVILMLKHAFTQPENKREYWKQFMIECMAIGIRSLPIVSIVSIFLGMVMTIQTSYQLISPIIPKEIISGVVRDSVILELSPTIICIILAGVVGSRIASELGNMQVSEQIDAIEIMGINTKAYLVLPKIFASLLMVPLLIIISITLAIVGGFLAAAISNIVPFSVYKQGLIEGFRGFTITVALVKAIVFGLCVAVISCYKGYYVTGGAIEIGKASTQAVVISCIAILLFDYLITALLL